MKAGCLRICFLQFIARVQFCNWSSSSAICRSVEDKYKLAKNTKLQKHKLASNVATDQGSHINAYSTVRLTVRVDPPPIYGQVFVIFLVCAGNGCFLFQTRRLAPLAPCKYPCFFYDFPHHRAQSAALSK